MEMQVSDDYLEIKKKKKERKKKLKKHTHVF